MENKVNLATSILREHFGDIVADLGNVLMIKGRQTVANLVEDLGIPSESVTRALLVSIQHNFVTIKEVVSEVTILDLPPEKLKAKVKTYYSINIENILLRLRFARYLETTKNILGEGESLVLEHVLANGRVTAPQAVAQAHQAAAVNARMLGHELEEDFSEEVLQTSFSRLVSERFIVRVGDLPPIEVENKSNKTSTKAKSTAKRGKKRKTNEEEGRGTEAVLPSIPSREQNFNVQALFSSEDSMQYWCLDTLHFHLHYRNQAMAQLILEKVDEIAAKIVQQIFKMTTRFICSKKDRHTAAVSLGNLYDAFCAQNPLMEIPKKKFTRYLEVLRTDFVLSQKDDFSGNDDMDNSKWVINIYKLTEILRNRVLESVIVSRYGALSLRIFRMLVMKKFLEEKTIAELAIIPEKETRRRLYQMMVAGFVHLQEVPRSAERTAVSTFYLWSVRTEEVFSRVLDDMYKTILNLRTRLMHEINQTTELARSESEALDATKLEAVQTRLEVSIIRLDESVMVLLDF